MIKPSGPEDERIASKHHEALQRRLAADRAHRLKAKLVPYSSVVGQIITLHDEQGRVVGQLGLHALQLLDRPTQLRTPADYRREAEAVATFVATAINDYVGLRKQLKDAVNMAAPVIAVRVAE